MSVRPLEEPPKLSQERLNRVRAYIASGRALRYDDAEALLGALDEARRSLKRLNRRCQSAESGLAAKPTSGPCMGRAFANASATMYHAKFEESQREIAALRVELRALRDALEAADPRIGHTSTSVRFSQEPS